jgi:hypothetical protein
MKSLVVRFLIASFSADKCKSVKNFELLPSASRNDVYLKKFSLMETFCMNEFKRVIWQQLMHNTMSSKELLIRSTFERKMKIR